MRNRLVMGLLALICLLALPVFAQNSDSGIISGRVTDSTGAVVPNAAIMITQTDTNVNTATGTNSDGLFRAPGLRDGPYKLTVTAAGFKKEVREGFALRIGQNLDVEVKLEVGAVTESVDVNSTIPLLDTQQSSSGQVMEGDYFYELPNYQHWEKGVLYYTPQVESSNAPWPGALGNWNINGGQTWQTATYEDGQMSTTMDGGTTLNSVSVGDEEIKVLTSAMPAEYGHATAGALLVVKKAGTNALHGEGGWLFKNDLLYHRRFFQLETTPQEGVKDFFQQPDFVISGPVWIPKIYNGKNKTFFEVAGSYHIDSSSNSSSYTIPTPQMLAGNFSAYSNVIYDANTTAGSSLANTLTRTPFPNNTVPQARFDNLWNNIMATNPFGTLQPNVAATINGTGPSGNYVGEGTGHYYNKTTQFRIDHSFTDKFKVFASLEVGYQHQPAINVNIAYTPLDQYQVYTLTYQNVGTVGATYTISPTLISETRVGEYRRTQNNTSPGGSYEFVMSKLAGLPSNVYLNPMGFGLSEGSNGSGQFGSGTLSINVNNIHTLREDITKLKGTHAFKFGWEWLWENGDNHNIGNPRLSLTYGGSNGVQPNGNSISNTGGITMVDDMLGLLSGYNYSQQGAPALPTDSIQSFYAQDDWRLLPKLTLNLGLRWSTETPGHNKFPGTMSNGSLTVPDNSTYCVGGVGSACVGGTLYPGAQSIPGLLTCPTGGCLGGYIQPKGYVWNRDWDHFTPRVGLAWNVANNTVVRAGFGMVTLDYNTGYESQNEIGGGSFYNQTVTQPANSYVPLFPLNNGVPAFVSVAQLANGEIPTSASTPSGRPGPTAYLANYHNPYTLNWNIAIQRALKKNYVVELSYVGMHNVGFGGSYNYDSRPLGTGIDTNGNVIDLTQPANWAYRNTWVGNSSGVNGTQAYKPFPDLGGMSVECNCIQMVYHSGTIKIEKRYSYGLSFLAFFTFQKGIQNNGGGNLYQQQAEGRSVTGQTQKYRFVSSMTYDLPFGKGRHWLNHGGVKNFFLGGYSFSWNYSIWAPTPEGLGYSGGDYYNVATGTTNGGRQSYPSYENQPGGGIYLIQDPKLRSDWQNIGTNRFVQAGQNPLVTNCGVSPIMNTNGTTWGNLCEIVTPSWSLGNLPSNEWIGQRIIGANASAYKNIPIKERVQMQVRFDYFNPFKWFNWNQPNTTMTQSTPLTFMTPGEGDNGDSTEGGPSEMQLSLRVRF